MKVFINQYGHINKSVLPLRFGISINQAHQSFANLNEAEFDNTGTENQRKDEIARGNKHYLGTLSINKENKNDGYYQCKGRFVIAPPSKYLIREREKRDVVVTALRPEIENLKSDIATTKHLEGMLKKNRITTEEIVKFLHPAYLDGRIIESNDIEEILADEIKPVRQKTDNQSSSSDKGIIESAPEIFVTIGALDDDTDGVDGDENKGPLVFKPLTLKSSTKFSYVMAEAYVVDTGQKNDRVWVTVINSKSEEQTLESFSMRSHLSQHHNRTAEYLKTRIGDRAFFAICVSEKYNGVLAESVTSIALDLMRDS
jgi:hypothetical protein